MATVKVPNYSEEQTTELKALWVEGKGNELAKEAKATFLETLATKYGKTARSIVAKLSKEGVYKAAEYVTKKGTAPVKKDAHADAIGKVLRLSEGDIDSLTKANKKALESVWSALANSRPIDPAEEADKASKTVKAAMIGTALDMDEAEVTSLIRVNASALDKVFMALGLSVEETEGPSDETQP